MDRLEAENVLLRHALYQAQWTVQFMHECLTSPATATYAYPSDTARKLEEWAQLAPSPKPCLHSMNCPDCEACEDRIRRVGEKRQARVVLQQLKDE